MLSKIFKVSKAENTYGQGRSSFPNLSVWYVRIVQHRKERKEQRCSLSSPNKCNKNAEMVFKNIPPVYFLQTMFTKVEIVFLCS